NFNPETHCGRAYADVFLHINKNVKNAPELMCAVVTKKKPNYVVLSRIKEDDKGFILDRKTDFCPTRPGDDGLFRIASVHCDPDGKTRSFNFTYLPGMHRRSSIQMKGAEDAIDLAVPTAIGLSEPAVFMSSDLEGCGVGKVGSKGPWYLKSGDDFVEIPVVCPRKKTLGRRILKKLSRSKPDPSVSPNCDPKPGEWLTISVKGEVYHLLFGNIGGFQLVEERFVLMAKRQEQVSLVFSLLRATSRTKLTREFTVVLWLRLKLFIISNTLREKSEFAL
ncbi:hypothetical protein FOZ63_013143, partial [Perkinsus olseni]